MTMTLVETIEVGSGGAASIEFTSIPQDGVDLLLVVSPRSADAGSAATGGLQFNSDTGSNYSTLYLYGTGSSAGSGASSAQTAVRLFYINGSGTTSNTFGSQQIYISNYTSSSAKSLSVDSVVENNATAGYQHLHASTWSGTSAISSIKYFDYNSNNLLQYSTASLYIIS